MRTGRFFGIGRRLAALRLTLAPVRLIRHFCGAASRDLPCPPPTRADLCARTAGQLRLVSTAPSSREFASTKAASYQVYKQYQMAVHGDTEDKCCMRTFERFLCATPLKVGAAGVCG